MKYIDPTGYFFKKIKKAFKKIKKYVKTIVTIAVAVVVTIYTGGAAAAALGSFWGAVATGAMAGAASGVVGTKLNGGSWSDALRSGIKGAVVGAVSAGTAYGVAEGASSLFNVSSKVAHSSSLLNGTGGYTLATFKALAHGISRVAIAKAQGHKTSSAFWSGFASSAFAATKSMGKWGGTALTAVVSGTVSQATGGKFANGAVTGAFVHLFNAWGGFRKLGGKVLIGKRGSMADKDNNMVAHEQFFFKDGSTIGYGSEGMIRSGENIADYSQLKYYDDNILKQAVSNVGNWNGADYNLFKHNCQDYAETVTNEYYKLGGK